ncbi:hypothetical protein MRX96_026966 [Rhipicephalus microplus]
MEDLCSSSTVQTARKETKDEQNKQGASIDGLGVRSHGSLWWVLVVNADGSGGAGKPSAADRAAGASLATATRCTAQ